MYSIAEIIENDRARSHIAEVSFHPSGAYFAATYENLNEVRIFDSQTRKLLQVLENPESQIDLPHGVLFTEKYLLISNAHDFKTPGTINVYKNDATIKQPVQIFETPFSHLREPHSLALRNGRLVVTYAENIAPSGAIVSYAFDEDRGTITRALDKTESWFSRYGEPKGICFNADGTKIFVTFESDKQPSIIKQLYWALASDSNLPASARLVRFGKTLKKGFLQLFGTHFSTVKSDGLEKPNSPFITPTKNGIATFAIGPDGTIARRPERVIVRKHFCRLENVDVLDGTGAVTDTANHLLLLYDLNRDESFTSPVHTLNFGKATPHAATFSPDGRLLIVSSLGRKLINQELRFGVDDWESPREDKIFVLERSI